ncbi:MAG: hypothetical protein BM557_07835 [Flavobacterium sp. MedPE-SWcel]|uniref:hypothetical protein n=1 Tax=uncultured Flavobacterium sp. TaxID=165435 RepID=UPI0009177B30|nr:hypothetical protein [uncultured Flavobacterium sp.]OIQ18116.1 MAG: hypothetical protein BM557_07835 [Flavobacterium sp. MedPE-SWcel]
MSTLEKIVTVLMLGIFCLAQAHTILPHVHHNHDDINKILEHHHHSTSTNNDQENIHDHHLNLLDHLLEGHSHDCALDDTVTLTSKKQYQFNGSDIAILSIVSSFSNINSALLEKYTSPNYTSILERSNDFQLLVFSHRGPPSIV